MYNAKELIQGSMGLSSKKADEMNGTVPQNNPYQMEQMTPQKPQGSVPQAPKYDETKDPAFEKYKAMFMEHPETKKTFNDGLKIVGKILDKLHDVNHPMNGEMAEQLGMEWLTKSMNNARGKRNV